MAMILVYEIKPACPKCKGEAAIDNPYCEEGNKVCPSSLHHHMLCNRCEFQWLMMTELLSETGMEPFTEDIICPKCKEADDTKFECGFCEKEHNGGPKSPHHHLTCTKCKHLWFMESAEIDIERSFDDLDQFVESCPKCRADNLEVKYMDDEHNRRCKDHSDMDIEGEHLHVKCGFCNFRWNSVTADFAEPKESESREEPKPEREVKEAKPM